MKPALPADTLHRVLNSSQAAGSKDVVNDSYKILILDKFSKDLLAPLLRLNDLRKHGVTLYLMLEAERQAVPDVPAVYFVQPTQAAVERIIQDAANGLYDSLQLNFTSPIPGRLLEQLATGTVKAGCSQRVGKVSPFCHACMHASPSPRRATWCP